MTTHPDRLDPGTPRSPARIVPYATDAVYVRELRRAGDFPDAATGPSDAPPAAIRIVSDRDVSLHDVPLSGTAGGIVAFTAGSNAVDAVSATLDWMIVSYNDLLIVGRSEASFTPDQVRLIYEALSPEFEQPGPTSRFMLVEQDIERYLQGENWGHRPADAPPPPEHTWPAWQRELMAAVRELSPAGVAWLREAVWRAFQRVQGGLPLNAALAELDATGS